LDDRREEEYRADLVESNLRYDNAFDTVLSHTPAMEIAEFWHLFGEEDDGGMVEVDAEIDLGEGTRLSLSDDAPAMPFNVSNPMHNPMHKPRGGVGADSMVVSEKPAASAWVTHTDPGSGKEYYHNTETDVTQWDKPPATGNTGDDKIL
jgi:hypothetical protein